MMKMLKQLIAFKQALPFLMVFYCGVVDAKTCPSRLAEGIYTHLKTHLSWVDINFEPEHLEINLRYYPCYASRTSIDKLLMEAIAITAPECMVVSTGKHKHKEGYCALEHVIFNA
jgi:hypothetical protein